MTPIPKNYSKAPLPVGTDIIFTATSPTLVGSVVGTTTNGTARSGSVGILKAGAADVQWVSREIAVASGASANLVPAKLSLDTGDALVVNATGQSVGQLVPSSTGLSSGCWPEPPTLILSTPDGSKIIASCPTEGIWLSEDGQQTARRVYATALSNVKVGAWFAGKFRIYTGATTSVTSADGVTWGSEACTNAPTSISFGACANTQIVGSDLYGATADQLKKSTDGLTFTDHGVASGGLSNAVCGFTFTGTNWVAAGISAANTPLVKYAASTAAAWTATSVGFSENILDSGVASNGTKVVIVGDGTKSAISLDHGVTFKLLKSATIGTTRALVSAGGAFVLTTSANGEYVLVGDGLWAAAAGTGSFTAASTQLSAFYKNDNGLIAPARKSVDATLSRRGGFTVTASVLELVP